MMEPKFVIQGKDYPVPDWATFTMDESIVLYDHAGLTLDQADEDTRFTPGLVLALATIALMRGNPGMSRKQAEKIVGAIPLLDALEHMADGDDEDEEDDAGPPARLIGSDGEPPSSPASNAATPNDSGTAGETGSDALPASPPPTPIGTPPSATPPMSDREISAA
jgi:hypothetical protein